MPQCNLTIYLFEEKKGKIFCFVSYNDYGLLFSTRVMFVYQQNKVIKEIMTDQDFSSFNIQELLESKEIKKLLLLI